MSNNLVLLLARILLVVVFLFSGLGKFTQPDATIGMIAAQGWPAPTLFNYLAGLLEIAGSLAILVGFQTRYAAYALALFSIAAGIFFHLGQGGDNQMMVIINMIMFMKNLGLAGGFLALAAIGAGEWSVDARRAGAAVAA